MNNFEMHIRPFCIPVHIFPHHGGGDITEQKLTYLQTLPFAAPQLVSLSKILNRTSVVLFS